MKSDRKIKYNSKSGKTNKEENQKKKKEQQDAKNKEKEKQYKKLEDYMNESGLSLAFNIIFAELISKQILPENFFTYTAMRLLQIGKEIEGLKTKDSIYVEQQDIKPKETEQDEETQQQQNAPEVRADDDVFMTQPNKQK